jgi:hypothetical protein
MPRGPRQRGATAERVCLGWRIDLTVKFCTRYFGTRLWRGLRLSLTETFGRVGVTYDRG